MESKHLDMIDETLHMLANKIFEETGHSVLIGWGITDGDINYEGAVTSKGLSYQTAALLALGINGYISAWYGGLPDDEAGKLIF